MNQRYGQLLVNINLVVSNLVLLAVYFDNVFVRGGYGYTDAKVKEDNQNPEREGNYLANTSKNTGNLFVRYLPTEQWYTEVGVTYVGSYYPNINNQVKWKASIVSMQQLATVPTLGMSHLR